MDLAIVSKKNQEYYRMGKKTAGIRPLFSMTQTFWESRNEGKTMTSNVTETPQKVGCTEQGRKHSLVWVPRAEAG